MYHSLVSLTGENSFLQYTNDNSWPRFFIRVVDAGYMLIPVYSNWLETAGDAWFWEQYFSKCAAEGLAQKRLLVTCRNLGTGQSVHSIAVRLDFTQAGKAFVADPHPYLPGVDPYELGEFSKCDYAKKAVDVFALESRVLDDYPIEPPLNRPE